jgi:hypothetical protein
MSEKVEPGASLVMKVGMKRSDLTRGGVTCREADRHSMSLG